MTDWADEIERTIADAYSSHGAILAADGDGMIAAALRNAVKNEQRLIAAWLKDAMELISDGGLIEVELAKSMGYFIERGEYRKEPL